MEAEMSRTTGLSGAIAGAALIVLVAAAATMTACDTSGDAPDSPEAVELKSYRVPEEYQHDDSLKAHLSPPALRTESDTPSSRRGSGPSVLPQK